MSNDIAPTEATNTTKTTVEPTPPATERPAPSRGLHVGLWVVQVLLALAFGLAGTMKLTAPIAKLIETMEWVRPAPMLPRVIGAIELVGVVGLLAPAATRIKPVLTPIAAVGFALIMVLAAAVHLGLEEPEKVPPVIVLLGLSVFVAWGRFKKAPIAAR